MMTLVIKNLFSLMNTNGITETNQNLLLMESMLKALMPMSVGGMILMTPTSIIRYNLRVATMQQWWQSGGANLLHKQREKHTQICSNGQSNAQKSFYFLFSSFFLAVSCLCLQSLSSIPSR
jgi:hypothetical protein